MTNIVTVATKKRKLLKIEKTKRHLITDRKHHFGRRKYTHLKKKYKTSPVERFTLYQSMLTPVSNRILWIGRRGLTKIRFSVHPVESFTNNQGFFTSQSTVRRTQDTITI